MSHKENENIKRADQIHLLGISLKYTDEGIGEGCFSYPGTEEAFTDSKPKRTAAGGFPTQALPPDAHDQTSQPAAEGVRQVVRPRIWERSALRRTQRVSSFIPVKATISLGPARRRIEPAAKYQGFVR